MTMNATMNAARVALILVVALAAMPLLRGRSAVSRRLVLSLAFVAALLVPFLPSRLATVHVDAPAYHALVATVVAEPAVEGGPAVVPHIEAVSSNAPNRSSWLVAIWLLGALAVGARVTSGHLAASRIARRASAAVGWSASNVRVSPAIDAPVVVGIFAPIIVVPVASATWSEARKEAVLLHERAHIAAWDLLVQVLASVVCALHWFNPLAWLAARRLRLERELAADESVLRAGLRASTYAEDLLAISGTVGGNTAGMISATTEPLARRILAIVAPQRPAPLGPTGRLGIAVGALAITLGVACTSPGPSPAPAPQATVVAPLPSPVSSPVSSSAASPSSPASAELQKLAAAELENAVATWRAVGGAILVLTPTGEVVAQAGDPDRAVVVGSTMKPLLLATAFEEGAVTETDRFESGAGKSSSVPELLATSNNPGFARIFERVGSVKHGRVLHDFHLLTPPTLDADAAIGATYTATPRAVALAYASLAHGGDGIVTPRTAARVSALLEGVVTSSEGTGKKARVAGTRVAGKTGTSEWTADAAKHTYASFVGYAPAEAPRYVIYVGVESPKGDSPWGGEVAAPVFARIATQALAN